MCWFNNKNYLFDIMSFHLMLSSEGGSQTYPSNHGGDFQVQLRQVMDIRKENWEVALVEMAYTGQKFPNLSSDNRSVSIRVSGKPEFENDYILTWDQVGDLHVRVSVRQHGGGPGPSESAIITFPQRHYSWQTFMETFQRLYKEKLATSQLIISDNKFYFQQSNNNLSSIFTIDFSHSFKTLFGIGELKRVHDHENRWVSLDVAFVKPKIQEDNSLLIHTPYAEFEKLSFAFAGTAFFEVSDAQYWTLDMLKRAFASISTVNAGKGPLKSLAMDNNQIIVGANDLGDSKGLVQLSEGLARALSITNFTHEVSSKGTLTLVITPVQCTERNIVWPMYSATKSIPKEFYFDAKSFIGDLNETLAMCQNEVAMKRNSSTVVHTFFSVGADNVSKFTPKTGFEVKLDADMLKMMLLPDGVLAQTTVATGPTTLKSEKRHHFYVHCDCLDYYYVNNQVSNIIKTVTNHAEVGEKVVLNFDNPPYFHVANRLVNSVNMYITDGLFEKILNFEREVVYTLHFRKSIPFQ
jgi:hypothetical protein